jgi:exodeoxyribonuclease VII large subunit
MSPNTLSISELNQRIATLLERNVPLLWVQGEISNLKQYPSGHWYFSLKDENAQARAVMFRQKAALLKWQPREGDAVQAYVSVGLYAARGDFQLTVESMRPAGLGTLYERFIKLKEDLAQQGLFDSKHKKALPTFVRKIGIVTSPQAAALRDVAHTLARRAPHIQLHIYPTLVQGELAAGQIARAIALANQSPDLEALLIIRGGGSLEDLWAFNEPEVAHAIFNSRLPIISGVGHETDTTIADFVADVRAATPTAAAELAAPVQAEELALLAARQQALALGVERSLQTRGQRLDTLALRLGQPARTLLGQGQRLDELGRRLRQALSHAHERHQAAPRQLAQRLRRAVATRLQQQPLRLAATQERLQALDPHRVLQRGYAWVESADGRPVVSSQALRQGQAVRAVWADGRAQMEVLALEPLPPAG